MRRLALAAAVIAFAVVVGVAGAQDFAFTAVPKVAGTITNLGAVGPSGTLGLLTTAPDALDLVSHTGSSFNVVDLPLPAAAGDPSSFDTFTDGGRVDVAILCANGLVIGVADGTGGFIFHVIPLTGAGGGDLRVGDFNGDGVADIAFTEPAGSDVGVTLGLGGGNFATPQALPAPGLADILDSLVIGRFDGDALPDIGVATGTGFDIFHGNGNGTFAAPRAIAINQSNLAMTDGSREEKFVDSTLDLFIATPIGVEVLENTTPAGSASVTFTGTLLPLPAGSNPVGVVVADLNHDNVDDIIALDRGSGNVSTFLAVSGSGYSQPDRQSVGVNPIAITLMNFNNDDVPDIAVANAGLAQIGVGDVRVLTGGGTGAFTHPKVFSLPFVPTPNGPGTGSKRTPPETITPPALAFRALTRLADTTGTYFWDINVPLGKTPLACGLFDAKTNRQIKNPLFPGVKQKMSCVNTKKTRVVHGVKKLIVHIALDLTVTKPAKGSATVWTEVFWR